MILPAKPDQAPVLEALQEAVARQSFPTLASAQAFADDFMARHNRQALDDFHGLSPEQMSQMLYAPFDSPDLVVWQPRVPLAACRDARFLWLFLRLAEAVGDDGLKATAKGNLPRGTCRELAQAYRSRFVDADDRWHGPVSTETDFIELHVVRVVAGLAGLIRKYKGRFILSQKYGKLIRTNEGDALHPALLECYIRRFNWAYWDHFPALPFAQRSFLFTLFLLKRYGNADRSDGFYADAFLRAFPAVLSQIPENEFYVGAPADTVRHIYIYRCLRRFAVFTGLAALQFTVNTESTGAYFDRYCVSVQSTPLLDVCWKF